MRPIAIFAGANISAPSCSSTVPLALAACLASFLVVADQGVGLHLIVVAAMHPKVQKDAKMLQDAAQLLRAIDCM